MLIVVQFKCDVYFSRHNRENHAFRMSYVKCWNQYLKSDIWADLSPLEKFTTRKS